MTIIPMNDQILILPKEVQEKTSSGLIIQGGDGDNRRGDVLAVGENVKNIKVGDDIFISWDKAVPAKIAGVKYAFVTEENVIAVIQDEQ